MTRAFELRNGDILLVPYDVIFDIVQVVRPHDHGCDASDLAESWEERAKVVRELIARKP